MRPLALLALMLLTACSSKMEDVVTAPVVIEEDRVYVEPDASAGLTGPTCQPGDDDGIGGTGCPIN